MGIAVSVVLIVVGAVWAFIPHDRIAGRDLEGPGIVLMLIGCLGLAVSVVVWTPSKRRRARRSPPTGGT